MCNSMKRIFSVILLICMCCTYALCSCTETKNDLSADSEADAESVVRFEDDAGRSFSLSGMPEKTAVLFSSYAEIWQAAGGSVDITVGESVERGFVPEGTPLVDDGAGKTINTELLLAEEPDFVICSADITAQAECAALLASAGIPAASFRIETFDDYLRVLRIFCDLTGNEDAYRGWGLDVQTRIRTVLDKAALKIKDGDEPIILFIRAATSEKSTKAKRAQDHFAAAMLQELGCRNIADDAEILLEGLSIEEIMMRNPDMIFISMMGEEEAVRTYMNRVLLEETWQTLDAVKNGSCFYLPKELFQYKPNMRWDEAYTYLYDLLYE